MELFVLELPDGADQEVLVLPAFMVELRGRWSGAFFLTEKRCADGERRLGLNQLIINDRRGREPMEGCSGSQDAEQLVAVAMDISLEEALELSSSCWGRVYLEAESREC